jgi:hypothetical protein
LLIAIVTMGTRGKTKDVRDRDGGWVEISSGALELSSLVKSIQQKVSRNKDEPKRKKAK